MQERTRFSELDLFGDLWALLVVDTDLYAAFWMPQNVTLTWYLDATNKNIACKRIIPTLHMQTQLHTVYNTFFVTQS